MRKNLWCIMSIFFVAVLLMFNCVSFSFAEGLNPLPDTGQDKCYDDSGEIPCPSPGEDFYGQDAQYNGLQQLFERKKINGDVVVVDKNTGLMWQQSDDGKRKDHEQASSYCGNLELAGYSDWRLPNIYELMSIINYGKYNPSVNTTFFSYKPEGYWSATDYYYQDSSFMINFENGYIGYDGYSGQYYTICVRGDTLEPGTFEYLTVNGDAVVENKKTGLMWQQSDDGKERSWKDALSYCENLKVAGYSDWRLPNIYELFSLVNYSKVNPTIDTSVFSCKSYYYWSATTCANYTGYAWTVDFGYDYIGNTYQGSKSYYNYVRCVRSGLIDNSGDLCDSGHLSNCNNETDCSNAGGYWYDNICNSSPKPAECNSSHLDLCTTESNCTGAGGYWYNNSCNSSPESTETSESNFKLTNNSYSMDKNLSEMCQKEFGEGWKIADWNNLKDFMNNGGKLEDLLDYLKMKYYPDKLGGDSAAVSVNGNEFYSGSRHYYISRHDHATSFLCQYGGWPSGGCYLEHDQLENHLISLGSWSGNKKVLCFNPDSSSDNNKCDSSHLDLCTTETDCTGAGGYWYDDSCNSTPKPSECASSHLDLCTTESDCTGAGGYWYDSKCNSTQQTTPGAVTTTSNAYPSEALNAEEFVFGNPNLPTPTDNMINVAASSSVYLQPSLKVDSSDVGKSATLVLYIYISNIQYGFMVPTKTVTLESEQKFLNLSKTLDFSSAVGMVFDVYYGYRIGKTLKYNAYRITVVEGNVVPDCSKYTDDTSCNATSDCTASTDFFGNFRECVLNCGQYTSQTDCEAAFDGNSCKWNETYDTCSVK